MYKRWVVAIPIVLFLFATANAQKTYPVTGQQFAFCPEHADALYCFLPLFGLHNVVNAGFLVSVQGQRLLDLNNLLGTETATLALPSPAAGVSFTFDPAVGTFLPSRESLGPILSDRAETLGAHRLDVAFTYQHFGFESLDGIPLHQLNAGLAQSVALRVDEFTTFLTYGLTKRIDVSAAFPVRTVHISGSGFALSATPPFPAIPGHSEAAGSSGMSDITLRAKAAIWKTEHGGLGLGLDVRTPTGEPLSFLGSGAFGAKPFLIASWGKSFHHVYLGPHLNVGYQWNGSSLLGGPLLGEEGRLPRVFSYAVGTEVGVIKRATMTLDLIGERLFNADRSSYVFNKVIDPTSVVITTRSINMKDGSVGAKVNPWRTLLLTGNLGVRLDRSGLRARLIPLGGVSYTF
jgi:hypothetical protein